MNIILYFFSYAFTLLGFLLGKSTLEEHAEIKKYVMYIIETLKVLFLFVVFYISKTNTSLLIVLCLFCFYIGVKYFDDTDFNNFFNILFLGVSFILISINSIKEIYLILILIFAIFLEKSFAKFNYKEEIYSFVIYGLIYIIYKIIIKVI